MSVVKKILTSVGVLCRLLKTFSNNFRKTRRKETPLTWPQNSAASLRLEQFTMDMVGYTDCSRSNDAVVWWNKSTCVSRSNGHREREITTAFALYT
jgi:hypothetical protein